MGWRGIGRPLAGAPAGLAAAGRTPDGRASLNNGREDSFTIGWPGEASGFAEGVETGAGRGAADARRGVAERTAGGAPAPGAGVGAVFSGAAAEGRTPTAGADGGGTFGATPGAGFGTGGGATAAAGSTTAGAATTAGAGAGGMAGGAVGLAGTAAGRERAALAAASLATFSAAAEASAWASASAMARKCWRTLTAADSSMELEWVFFSVTPTSGSTSIMALDLTSSSRARSLMRI